MADLQKGLVEVTGVLAHVDQADVERRKHLGVAVERPGQGKPLLQVGGHRVEGFGQQRVAHRQPQPADGAGDGNPRLGQGVHLTAEHDQLIEIDLLQPADPTQLDLAGAHRLIVARPFGGNRHRGDLCRSARNAATCPALAAS